MKKKIITSFLCSALVVSALSGGAFASPSRSDQISSQFSHQIVIGQDEISKKMIGALEDISPFISVGEDNLYHIDPAAKEVVSLDVYNQYAKGVSNLNVALQSNATSPNIGTFNSSKISPYAFANDYWWGIAITFNNQETKDFIYACEQTAQIAAVAALLAAFIPVLQLTSVVAALESIGLTMVANSMSYHNNGKGVTLNLHWGLSRILCKRM